MAASPTTKEKFQLTDRINRIQVSPTAAVIAEADKLKTRGVDVADFGPGEPDFPTPDHIKKAAIKAIDENKTKYTSTAGIMPLREAICAGTSANWVPLTKQKNASSMSAASTPFLIWSACSFKTAMK